MPVHVKKGEGKRPYKIVNQQGHVEGSSKTKKNAEKSARIRNKASKKK